MRQIISVEIKKRHKNKQFKTKFNGWRVAHRTMPCPTAVEYCIFAVVLLCYPAAVRLDSSTSSG